MLTIKKRLATSILTMLTRKDVYLTNLRVTQGFSPDNDEYLSLMVQFPILISKIQIFESVETGAGGRQDFLHRISEICDNITVMDVEWSHRRSGESVMKALQKIIESQKCLKEFQFKTFGDDYYWGTDIIYMFKALSKHMGSLRKGVFGRGQFHCFYFEQHSTVQDSPSRPTKISTSISTSGCVFGKWVAVADQGKFLLGLFYRYVNVVLLELSTITNER